MGMSAGGGGSTKSEINVTPLVDVCLVLLIIFMVMVPQSVPEIPVRVPPEAAPTRRSVPPQTLVLGLTKEGAITLNREPIERSQLAEELSRQLATRERRVVFADFDADVDYGVAVEVLDLAKSAGAEVLGIVKDRGPSPATLRG